MFVLVLQTNKGNLKKAKQVIEKKMTEMSKNVVIKDLKKQKKYVRKQIRNAEKSLSARVDRIAGELFDESEKYNFVRETDREIDSITENDIVEMLQRTFLNKDNRQYIEMRVETQ